MHALKKTWVHETHPPGYIHDTLQERRSDLNTAARVAAAPTTLKAAAPPPPARANDANANATGARGGTAWATRAARAASEARMHPKAVPAAAPRKREGAKVPPTKPVEAHREVRRPLQTSTCHRCSSLSRVWGLDWCEGF
jgi:hypothetical protein